MHIKLYSGVFHLNNLCAKYIIDRKKKITQKEIKTSDLKTKEQIINVTSIVFYEFYENIKLFMYTIHITSSFV